jgi:NADH-quinone oxidoreductase subunit F
METPLTKNIPTNGDGPLSLKAYERAGGSEGLRKALRMTPAAITDLVTKSKLRGRGGAGFSTGMKWSFVPMGTDTPHPKYLVANADEMEPGTFKDRLLLEGDPHQLIEGMIVAGYAVQADIAYIFLRAEYKLAAERLRKAIAEAYENRHLGKNILGSTYSLEMYLHVSAGRYMCGEETGLLNALEGKRANPRSKPPFPQVSGLWGKPTIVQNVETLCNLPHIVNNGPEWFKSLSHTADGGTNLLNS